MINIGYNPATSGFAAKAWECLRRNSDFRSDVEAERKAKTMNTRMYTSRYMRGGHPCSGFVGHCLSQGGFVTQKGAITKPFSERDEWPALPREFKRRLAILLNGELPVILDPPSDIDDLYKHFPYGDPEMSHSEMYAQYVDWNWPGYVVVRIPVFVRDKGHRKLIIARLEKCVPLATKDLRKFAPTGVLLGSKSDWEAFLVAEHYIATGYAATQAKWMAAWYCFDRKDFNSWGVDGIKKFPNLALKQAKAVYARKGTHIDDRVANIRRAIAKVYPVFSPFQ